MATYLAHYKSPAAADVRGAGVFEFDSDARANSKDNLHDARLKMLEIFGKDAASWSIERVERKTANSDRQQRSPRRSIDARFPPREEEAEEAD